MEGRKGIEIRNSKFENWMKILQGWECFSGGAAITHGGTEGYRDSKFEIRKLDENLTGVGSVFQGVSR